ncbi:MAG TPA: hypothetical protein ENN19_02915 [Chloroflexi bacterium]|nr:hypothetical protein [Chloroflexota bacterium]
MMKTNIRLIRSYVTRKIDVVKVIHRLCPVEMIGLGQWRISTDVTHGGVYVTHDVRDASSQNVTQHPGITKATGVLSSNEAIDTVVHVPSGIISINRGKLARAGLLTVPAVADSRFVGGRMGMVGVLHTLRQAQGRPGDAT